MDRKRFIQSLGILAGAASWESSNSIDFMSMEQQNAFEKDGPAAIDAVIVGGGMAGLSAALLLGRADRRTLVIDSGSPRNREAPYAHNYLTRDHTPPAELIRLGREEVGRYPSVQFLSAEAQRVEAQGQAFRVKTSTGEKITARGVILAAGIADQLPALPGIERFWGRTVILCPFCHGYEFLNRPTGVLLSGDPEMALARIELLYSWSKRLTVFMQGQVDFTAEQLELLKRKGVRLIEEPISELAGDDGRLRGIRTAGGEMLEIEVLYVHSEMTLRTESLGIKFSIEHSDSREIMMKGQTNVPGLYVAGDASGAMQQLVSAAYTGSLAGVALHHYLAKSDFHATR